MSNKTEYLTESLLYDVLENRYGRDCITRQKPLPNRKRVDYYLYDVEFNFSRNSTTKTDLIVEFDGNRHYQQDKTIQRDIENNKFAIANGIHVIHIPYWVQLNFAIPFFFNTPNTNLFTANIKTGYPNGFIDGNCVHPVDFSFDGWGRFIYELSCFPTTIREDVRGTMTDKENKIYDSITNSHGNQFMWLYDSVNWIDSCMFG